MILSSENDIHKINDILLGEVWIAAGQSNMEMTFDYCCNTTDSSESEVLSANFPNIRMYNVKKVLSNEPLDDTDGEWVSAVNKKNESMREALARVWNTTEDKNPFKKESKKDLTKEVKDGKTMTGKKIASVEVNPKIMEKKK